MAGYLYFRYDNIMKEDFESMMSRSYGYDSKKHEISNAWKVVRALYENNYIEEGGDAVLPKKIHQIWFGGKLPLKYNKLTDTWKKHHPDWEYKLWTDSNVGDIELTKKDVFNFAKNNGMKSDILRYEILKQLGGLYIDTDFECLKPFDDLRYLEFITGVSYDAEMVLYIGLIGSVPCHNITQLCVNSLNTRYDGDNAYAIMDATGPYYFTRCFLNGVDMNTKGVVAFPMDYFYPLPNNIRGTSTPYQYVRPCSYAIHHWDVSWIKSK
jgi:mannosyltransferase OCH1-like enzyme